MVFTVFHVARWVKLLLVSLLIWGRSLIWLLVNSIYNYMFRPVFVMGKCLLWDPMMIASRVATSLFLLPINIPLYIILGTSFQKLASYGPGFLNAHILLTLIQYSIVLFIFGVTIGSIAGSLLGMTHYYLRVPNVYLDLTLLSQYIIDKIKISTNMINKPIANIWQTVKNLVIKIFGHTDEESVTTQTQTEIETETKEPVIETPRTKIPVAVHSRSNSTASVLDVASVMPSDFFQPGKKPKRLVVHIEPSTRDRQLQTVYNTPIQSPQRSSTLSPHQDLEISNDSSLMESEPSGIDLWDRFDSIDSAAVHGTMRTDNTTMRTTRVSKKPRRHSDTFSDRTP
ncbi:similar to Saccharomyces cerevisiae YCL005W LDB16 Protein of unknown function [Maudiozyma saulgeensis]|uniref:Uncharacterized protein n=1 Tax=Maudiozyma saulgeensis TaxID=1789683 RepID=A0A1X7R8J3_9SACH|nr:similar to Saccharomyces cerevisiae YCL005W LDB16 Protein of unknown function [Kazachstania saulgeensis]